MKKFYGVNFMYKNSISSILSFLGWFNIIVGIILFPIYCILSEDILSGVLVFAVCIISSIFIFGFAEIINLLHNNNKKQDLIIEMLSEFSKEK